MLSLPSAAKALIMSFSVAFTNPTFQRFVPLCVGAILAAGRRTVTGMLWSVRALVTGHPSSYHRVFSRAVWSLWPLGRIVAAAVLRLVPTDEPILVPMDDTTAQHRGKHVYGKGCHHDAVRSSHSHVVWRWGHRWVVLAIATPLPFTSRRWALPVLAALYRPEQLNRAEGRRHKTPPELARQLAAVLIRWFPRRRFVFLGDGGFASHGLAEFFSSRQPHAALVSRFHGDANLYAPPPPRRSGQNGRPRKKGHKLPSPQQVVARSDPRETTVGWYGGATRRVAVVSGVGHWYKAGRILVPIRWVFVRDLEGTHRDEYFYTTDMALRAEQIVTWFTARWPIETTFQEMRAHLGLETTRQRTAKSVLRTAPCLLGLFTVVSLIYAEHTRRYRVRLRNMLWYAKEEPTFSDAIAAVRRLFWAKTIFETPSHSHAFSKIPRRFKNLLLDYLSQAA